ncbi:MAG TPA: threonine--tRNA ligase [Thermomicrobiales bacterium]|nr:threonine--tRNA ligase [Thermomicrobiales bacterium]
MSPEEQDVATMDIAVDPADWEAYELARMRHSTAHLMAEAVQELFPDAKFGIGPAIENGFYYDFDLPRPLTPDDLKAIEKLMKRNQKRNDTFERNVVSREEAMEIFKDNPYKLELIQNFPEGETISTYQQGNFLDLCRGPHVESTKQIGPFKLQSVAGAYWRGDEKRPMLQRIYGTAWRTKDELADYLHKLEEAAKRDHRRLGKDLDLFSVNDEIGPGLILWHPKGAMIRYLVEQFEQQEQLKRGYDLVYTPHIASEKIYKTSGHLETYHENMYSPMSIEEVDYYLKPMNCPGHIMIYNSHIHSYKELPIRLAELGTVYRYERSGTLHGMLRVRGFTQDDSHIFCTHDQVVDEVGGVIDLALHMADIFGYGFEAYLGTRPEKAIGDEARWNEAIDKLKQALDSRGMKYKLDEGEGAFYGPKIDIKWLDALGRAWTGPTIQVDFNLPERFDVNYIGEDGGRHRAAMIHRTLLGSMERFVGGLVEHYGGAFPAWLAPIQAEIIPITDDQVGFAYDVQERLKDQGIRAEVNDSSGRMQAKIRQAQLQKIPYMLVVGAREAEADSVAVRLRTGEDLGAKTVTEFLELVAPVIETKSLSLTEPRETKA